MITYSRTITESCTSRGGGDKEDHSGDNNLFRRGAGVEYDYNYDSRMVVHTRVSL